MKTVPLLLALLSSGCATQVLPPKVHPSAFTIDQPVHVKSYRYPAYSESLKEALAGTRVFTAVTTAKTHSSESYVAEVNRQVHGNAVIPLLTFISLGIIPTVTEEEFGESFFLRHKGETHRIEATWKGHTTLGWVALFMNFSPSRTFSDPESHSRFHAFLRSKIQESIEGPRSQPTVTHGR
jgi:hypothetical protein